MVYNKITELLYINSVKIFVAQECVLSMEVVGVRRLWLRGRASFLLSEGRWFDFPGLHVKVSLGNILNPKLLV